MDRVGSDILGASIASDAEDNKVSGVESEVSVAIRKTKNDGILGDIYLNFNEGLHRFLRRKLNSQDAVEDVAQAAMYLVEADYITGEVIVVDGGQRFGHQKPDRR